MKRIAGFITGLVIASVLWFGFNHFSIMDFSNQNKEEIKQTISKTISSVKGKIASVNSEKEGKPKEIVKPLGKSAIKSIKEQDIDPSVGFDSDIAESAEVVAIESLTQKQYFWQPFDLQSKADGFSKYVSSNSGVNCMAEKTGVGKFMIYFLYENEEERDEKVSLIEQTGLNLKIVKLTKEE